MFKTRFISILALLCLTVSGAWAQQETLLTTILSTGDNRRFKSGSKTFDNIATVTISGDVGNDDDEYGWYCEEGTLTVTAAEGYTITRVKFYTNSGSAFDEQAPFEAILVYDGEYFCDYFTKVNGNSIGEYGVTKIEVYGYANAPATVAVTGVTLAPTSATLTLGETETVTLIPTVLPAEATDKSVTWSSSDEAVATVTNGVVTAVAAGTATITVTTTDGAKTATCAVTVAAPAASTYTVTLKEGTEDATSWTIAPAEATTTGVAAGTEVTATYSGTKKVKSVKAVKKAVAPEPVTYTNLQGGEVLHVGDIIEVPVGQEWSINNDFYFVPDNNPFTVVRVNITGNPGRQTVTEAADGAYYVIKLNNGSWKFTGSKKLPVTETSDGIYVTYNGIQGGYPSYTFSVHEP